MKSEALKSSDLSGLEDRLQQLMTSQRTYTSMFTYERKVGALSDIHISEEDGKQT